MSATADHAETNLAVRLGFQPDMVVQEIGYDEDAEEELREVIEPPRARNSSTRTTTTWPTPCCCGSARTTAI